MSEDYENKQGYQAQSSETLDGQSGVSAPDMDYVRPAEIPEQDLYHGHTFLTKWVFCQDAKVIGVQYFLTAVFTGIIGLILSWLMRLQLGFPGLAGFMTAEHYYQFVTMHGMIMVVYFLTALFLGGFGNYLIPLMVGARDMVFPYVNMLSFWMFFCSCCSINGKFLCARWSNRSRLDIVSTSNNFRRYTRIRHGDIINVGFAIIVCNWFHNGRTKLFDYNFAG